MLSYNIKCFSFTLEVWKNNIFRLLKDLQFCQKQGSLTEWEGPVQLTYLYSLVYISHFLYWKYFFSKVANIMRR